MENKSRKNLPDFRDECPKAGNYPKNSLRGFCNAFLTFCNGIAQRHRIGGIANTKFGVRAEPFNGSATRTCNGIAQRNQTVVFENETAAEIADGEFVGTLEIAIGENSTAEYCIAPYGKHPHERGLQIVDAAAANEMGRGVSTLWKVFKEKFGYGNPVPVYRSHPDSENFVNALDKMTYGTVKKIYAGERGVMAQIDWCNDFRKLPKKMMFSPRWKMARQPDGNFRPTELLSIGLTYTPNIDNTDFANEKTNTKENPMLKNILKALGFTEEQAVAAETNAAGAPTEEEIVKKITSLKAPAAPNSECPEDNKKPDDAAENENLRKVAAAERTARAKMVIDNCIAEGRMTKADEAAALEVLCNAKDFDSTAKLFTSRNAVWANSSKTGNLAPRNAEEAANEASENARAASILARADTIAANEKIPYRQAYAKAEAEYAQKK
jgi:hypothetical protein